MDDEKNIRAFLAIDPPEVVREEMGRIQNRLKNKVRGAVSWTRPEGIHLTLKFFGNIGREDVGFLSEIIEEGVTGVEPLAMEIRSLGVFPDIRRPRVIWLGTVGDVERLGTLQRNLDRGFAALGFAKEERPFRAHWTLGRVKSQRGQGGMAQMLEMGKEIRAGAFVADRLILFRSELKPQGAVYTRLAEYVLNKKP